MPTIHGVRNAEKFDVWDCLVYGGHGQPYTGRPDEGPLFPSTRIFGNANVGNLSLTNLQVPGMIAGDRTALVTNWYARTNIPEGPELDAMAQKVFCTLIIGMMPQRQTTLRELLHRPCGAPLDHHPDKDREEKLALVEAMAGLLYEANLRELKSTTPADVLAELEKEHPLDQRTKIGAHPNWRNLATRAGSTALPDDVKKHDAEVAERERWLRVGATAVGVMRPSPTIVVPVRQNISVQADVFSVHEEFNRWLRRMDEPNWDKNGNRVSYLQRPPGHPSDRPGIWIHLEGWLVSSYDGY
jgi:hypothetical protein